MLFDSLGWPPHLLADFPVASVAHGPASWLNLPHWKVLQRFLSPYWSLAGLIDRGGVTVYLGGNAPLPLSPDWS